jgi:DUF4097 and DUF4098 domain-containing protein YvlB
MKGREIVLLIFILVAGVLLTQTYRGNINWEWGWDDWNGSIFGPSHEFTAQESRTIEPPLPAEVAVDNRHGEVEIVPAADGRITVVLEKRARRRTEEEARAAAEGLHLTLDQQGSKLVLSTNRDEFRRGFNTVFRISVPEGLPVDVRNSYGPVKAVGTGRTKVDNTHGSVTLQDIRGPLTCQTSYEDVMVTDAAADCEVDCRNGAVTILRVKGTLRVSASYDRVRVEEAEGEVVINGSHADILGRRLGGPVRVETTYRDINLAEVGPATVVGHHSAIEVKGVRGDLDLSDTYGGAKVEDIQGGLVVHGRSLEVSGRGLSGPTLSISTTYRDVDLAGFSGKTEITIAHGDVSLRPERIAGGIEVKGEYSEIRLEWPAGAESPVEARARDGRVRWSLPVGPDLEQKNGFSLLKAFGRVEGRAGVILNTTHGDIIIEPARPPEKENI